MEFKKKKKLPDNTRKVSSKPLNIHPDIFALVVAIALEQECTLGEAANRLLEAGIALYEQQQLDSNASTMVE
jgi:hypothetical protein